MVTGSPGDFEPPSRHNAIHGVTIFLITACAIATIASSLPVGTHAEPAAPNPDRLAPLCPGCDLVPDLV